MLGTTRRKIIWPRCLVFFRVYIGIIFSCTLNLARVSGKREVLADGWKIHVKEYVKNLQPLWFMLFAGQIKVLLTFLVFGFEMKVCEVGPSASSSCSGLQEFAPYAYALQWIFSPNSVDTLRGSYGPYMLFNGLFRGSLALKTA